MIRSSNSQKLHTVGADWEEKVDCSSPFTWSSSKTKEKPATSDLLHIQRIRFYFSVEQRSPSLSRSHISMIIVSPRSTILSSTPLLHRSYCCVFRYLKVLAPEDQNEGRFRTHFWHSMMMRLFYSHISREFPEGNTKSFGAGT
jgi:hypothetical protein